MEAFFQALTVLLTPSHLVYLVGGVTLGLCVGILPGLGGIVGMTILLPVIYGMDIHNAFALLIGMVAVIPTSDTFPSVMMGIPGSSASQATIMDGYPLAKKGEAARALGAAFTASLIGGLFGAFVLSLIIPIARPLVLAFGSPELFMLAVLGMSMVGVLSGNQPIKGIIGAGIGLMLGAIGDAPAIAEYRYTFGFDYLMDGISLVIVGLGLFAFPEIIDLLIKGRPIAEKAELGRGWFDGLKDTLRHKWIVLRCATIGVIIGFIPGLGGSVVDWIAYGHIIQTSKDRERFGKGDIRGVIAPESANNAKEGGGLIPVTDFQGRPAGFMKDELQSRRELNYPPFSRLALLTFSGENEEAVHAAAKLYHTALNRSDRFFAMHPPQPAMLSRINRRYRWQLLLRIEKTRDGDGAGCVGGASERAAQACRRGRADRRRRAALLPVDRGQGRALCRQGVAPGISRAGGARRGHGLPERDLDLAAVRRPVGPGALDARLRKCADNTAGLCHRVRFF